MTNPYKILGVREDAPEETIEASYRQLAKKHHPDSEEGDKEMFKKVQSAYNSIQNSSDTRGNFDSSSKESSNSNGSENEQTLFEDFFQGTPADEATGTGTPGEVEVDGDYLTATLTGIDNRDLDGLARRILNDDDHSPLGKHPVITFDIYNKSDQVLRWSSSDTKVVDTDGYTYENKNDIMIKEYNLGPRWTAVSVEIEPGARTKFATTFGNIPDEAEIEKIVHTLPVFKPHQVSGAVQEYERYVFEINRWPSLPAGIDEK